MKAPSLLQFVITAAIVMILLNSCMPKDATDPPDGRSGMGLYTDHGTGCQYLSKPFGDLRPRLNTKGQHVCNYRDQAP